MRTHPKSEGNVYQRLQMIRRVVEEGWPVMVPAHPPAARMRAGASRHCPTANQHRY
jgi:hypothetical protein